jgi:hypothetical protein
MDDRAEVASQRNQPVTHVTELGVFQLSPDGLELIEIAPGVDLERDVLAGIAFRPHMPPICVSWIRASSGRDPDGAAGYAAASAA